MNINVNHNQSGCPYPWLTNQWRSLVARLKQNNLPHALLLTGPQGMGKRDFAENFAKLVLCQQAMLDTGNVCGHCRACQLLQAGTHPDLLSITTLEESKMIKIDQIRELSEVLAQSAQKGGYKVVIVQDAEKMNNASANALLKTLEEPGAKTLLMLITAYPALLLATVRSRCQRIYFHAIGAEESENARQWLENSLTKKALKGLDEEVVKNTEVTDPNEFSPVRGKNPPLHTAAHLSLLLSLSEGAPLRAHSLIRDGLLEKRLQLWEGVNTLGMKTQYPLTVATQCLSLNVEPLDVLEWLSSWIMDMIRSSRSSDIELVNSDVAPELQLMAKGVTEHRLFKLLDELLDFRHQWLSKINLNYQLMLEAVISQWYLLFAAK
jgi:DNA polymerase III subunit delta'